MLKQTVLWTALPKGIKDGQLQLSVFVSPRLQTNAAKAQLSEFPDFVDWPAISNAIQFTVHFENGPSIPANRVSPNPESQLWQALFSNTFVESYQFDDYTNNFIHSYPVLNVLSTLKQVYQTVALESPTDRPKIKDLLIKNKFGQIADLDLGIEWQRWIEQLKNANDQRAVAPKQPDVKQDFRQLKWFYRPPGKKPDGEIIETVQTQKTMVKDANDPNKPAKEKTVALQAIYLATKLVPLPNPEDFANMIDFHIIVSALGEFPELMRKVGLVIDLAVPMQGSIPANSRVRIKPDWSPAIATGQVPPPRTAYSFDKNKDIFVARSQNPNDPEIVDGMLNLSDKQKYELIQLDVDGMALKAMNFADNMSRLQDPNKKVTTIDSPEDAGLPSLKTTGFAIIRPGRAAKQAVKFNFAKIVNTTITTQQDTTLYAEDLLRGFRVDVWDAKSSQWHSLCRRKGSYEINPNIKFDIEDEGVVSAALTSAADGSSDDFYMHESLFHWDGWSLCAPRPGGVILPNDEVEMPSGTGQHAGQFKNEAAPGLPLSTTFSAVPGSLPRLRFGEEFRLRARAVDLAGNSRAHDEPNPNDFSNTITAVNKNNAQLPYVRFEPVSSPILVLRQEPKEGESLERQAIRSFNDDPSKDVIESQQSAEIHVAPPKTSQMTAELHGKFDAPNNGAMKKDSATYNMIAQKDGGKFGEPNPGDYTIRPEAKLTLPYLPDPLSFGAAFRGLPNDPLKVRPIVFDPQTDWHDLQPFRIKVEEGNSAPDWDPSTRVLRVQLAKAEVATVRYSSYFGSLDDLDMMGIWQWIAEQNPFNLSKLKKMARNGEHWMLTPFRELVLVHAVQQPLPPLQIQGLDGTKTHIGNTYASINGTVKVHGKSSDKIDVMANWQEPLDDPTDENNNPAEDKLDGQARAFEVMIDLSEQKIAAAGGSAQYNGQNQELTLGRLRHEFGDTRYRRVNYSVVATSRFREYFNSDNITNHPEKISRTWGQVTLDILNSARPAAPKVLYVIPTFGWEEVENQLTGEIISQRKGGGLRVYMERPWFSSGDGELLGIVLWQGRTRGDIAEKAKPYVTQWGMDPIWGSKPTPTRLVPTKQQFSEYKDTQSGLTLDELPDSLQVATVAYDVHYDPQRQLWYADIEMDPGGSYNPFVRLALARFQPNSIDHAHLSRVVLADFAQLAPDRSVTLTRDGDKVKVVVSGVSYNKAPIGGKEGTPKSKTSEMKVTLESRPADSGIDDPELGWTPVTTKLLKAKTKKFSRAKSIKRRQPQTQITIWQDKIKLPSTSQQQYRLLVKEYEVFLADKKIPEKSHLPGKWGVQERRRLVYAHAIALTI